MGSGAKGGTSRAASSATVGHRPVAPRSFSASSTPSWIARNRRWSAGARSANASAPGASRPSEPETRKPRWNAITSPDQKTTCSAARATSRTSRRTDGGRTSWARIVGGVRDANPGATGPRYLAGAPGLNGLNGPSLGRGAGRGERARVAARSARLAELLAVPAQKLVRARQVVDPPRDVRGERALHAAVRSRVALLLAPVAETDEHAQPVRLEREERMPSGEEQDLLGAGLADPGEALERGARL